MKDFLTDGCWSRRSAALFRCKNRKIKQTVVEKVEDAALNLTITFLSKPRKCRCRLAFLCTRMLQLELSQLVNVIQLQ